MWELSECGAALWGSTAYASRTELWSKYGLEYIKRNSKHETVSEGCYFYRQGKLENKKYGQRFHKTQTPPPTVI